MNYYFLKLSAIIIILLTCIIATYTDIKYQIIPNKLTFTVGIIGLALGIYYCLSRDSIFILSYLLTIVGVYGLSYFLWHIGLWAGGDVKLFTALSALFIRDYFDILPVFNMAGIIIPVYPQFISPIFDLILNSVFSVLPLILMIITYEILKNKIYLIKDIIKTINLIDMIITFNALMIFTLIDNLLDVDVVIALVLLLLISYINKKLSQKNEKIAFIMAVILLLLSITQNIFLLYLAEFISITIIYLIRAVIKSQIFSKALRNYVKIDDLKESMVLAYDLSYDGDKYYFDKRSLKERLMDKSTDEIIISSQASGLSVDDINFINKLYCEGLINDKYILTKKTLSFGPFILAGLIITLTIGDVYLFIIHLGCMIL